MRARAGHAELRIAVDKLLDSSLAAPATDAAKQLATMPALRTCFAPAVALQARVVVEADKVVWAQVERVAGKERQAACVERALSGAPFALPAPGRTFLQLALDAVVRPVPSIRIGSTSATGDLDKAIIRRYVGAHAEEITACAVFRKAGTTEITKLALTFQIRPDGTVDGAAVTPSTGEPGVDECAARAAARWRFPAPKGGGFVRVNYPFDLRAVEASSEHDAAAATFRARFLPAMLEGTVTALAQLPDGRLALGTAGLGVHFYDGTTIEPARWPLASAEVRAIVSIAGGLVVATDRGAMIARGSAVDVITPLPTTTALEHAGTLYLGTERGLQSYRDGAVTPVAGFDPTWSIDKLDVDEDGRVRARAGDREQRAGDLPVGRSDGAGHALVDPMGNRWAWLRDFSELEMYDKLTGEYRRVEGIAGRVRDALVTRDGGLVVVTDAGLFQRVEPRIRRAQSPVFGHDIYQVVRSPRGALVTSEIPEERLAEAVDGTEYRIDGPRLWRVDRVEAPLFTLDTPIRTVDIAGDATVYFGTDTGLLVARPGQRPAHRLPVAETGAVAALVRVGDRLFVGAERGLWQITPTNVSRVRTERVRHLASAAGLVAAASAQGLLVLDDNGWRLLTSERGLSSDEVRAVAILDDGTVVAATAGGLDLVRRGEPLRDGAVRDEMMIRTLTKADGLPNAPIESLYADPDGTLWIGTLGAGLHELVRTTRPPAVAIRGIRIDGRARPIATALTIPWAADLLSIQTTATTWIDRPENVVVETELVRDGAVVARKIGDIELPISELGDGVQLRIVARGVDGVASEPTTLMIDVEPPPWKRPALVVLVLALVTILVGGIVGWPHLRRRLVPRLALRRARKRLARDPASAVAVALELYRELADPVPVLRTLASATKAPETSATLRIFELLGRDPEAGLRMARSRRGAKDKSPHPWLVALDVLGRIAMAQDIAAAAAVEVPTFEAPADRATLRGIAEVLGVLAQYGEETSGGKRWDYLRGAHEYLGTLVEQARSDLPAPINGAAALVATELRRRIALEMRAQDWRADARDDSDSVDSRKLRFVVENEFPRPVAHAFSRIWRETEPAGQAPALGSLLETLLAYLGCILAADAIAQQLDAARSDARKRLVGGAPSAGDWLGLARTSATALRDAGRDGPGGLARALAGPILEALDAAVAQRNRLVHRHVGITREDIEQLLGNVTSVLGSLNGLREAKLVVLLSRDDATNIQRHRGRLLHGFQDASEEVVIEANVELPLGAPLLVSSGDRRVLDLRPLFTYAACEQCGAHHLFWFSRLGKAVDYASAEGHPKKAREAIATVDAWLAAEVTSKRAIACEVLAADFDLASARRRLPAGYVLKHEAGVEIEAHVGQGGFADVYRARRTDDGKQLAVKVLPYQYLRDPTLVRRFRQEATAARRFEHGNVVRVYGFGEDAGDYFLVMELATGWIVDGARVIDLRELPKPITPALALDIARQTLAGLAYIHGEGIVHRDIKPANLLLFDDGSAEHRIVKLADFGTARTHQSLHLTRTGLLAATPEYMSPEQAEGSEADARSDLYSLGIVLYELLSGELPFKGDSPLALALARIRGEPKPLASVAPKVPKPLAAWIHELLVRDPAKRPKTAMDAALALERAQAPKVA